MLCFFANKYYHVNLKARLGLGVRSFTPLTVDTAQLATLKRAQSAYVRVILETSLAQCHSTASLIAAERLELSSRTIPARSSPTHLEPKPTGTLPTPIQSTPTVRSARLTRAPIVDSHMGLPRASIATCMQAVEINLISSTVYTTFGSRAPLWLIRPRFLPIG